MASLVGPVDFRMPPFLGGRASSIFTTYYVSPVVLISTTTSAVVANVLYYQPIYLPNFTIDRIGIDVTTGASGNCRLGLYTNSANMPSQLILDCGTVSTTSIATVEATIASTQLPSDWVWMAAVFDATPTIRVGTAALPYLLGSGSVSVPSRGLSVSSTYGTMASTAVAPTQFVAVSPMMFVRKT